MSAIRPNLVIALLVLGLVLLAVPVVEAQNAQSPEVVISDLPIDQYLPQVAYNSHRKEYFVVWHNVWPVQARDIYGARVDHNGNLIAQYVISSAVKDRAQPSVAYDPQRDRYLVAWMFDSSGAGTDWDIYGRIVPWNGPSGSFPEFYINTWTSNQWTPKVEYAGTQQEFMVVWENEASGVPWYLSGQRVDAATGNLVSTPFTVVSGSENRINHDLAYNQARNELLVVYQVVANGGGDIYGVRMTASGAVLGGGEFGIAAWPDPEEDPTVGASRIGDTYVVAWHNVLSATDQDSYVRLVNGDGSLDGGPLLVAQTPVIEGNPDVACYPESTTCLVAWEQQYSSTVGPRGISARTVGLDHSLGAPFAPRPVFIGEDINCYLPAIAGGSDGWLVAWEHDNDPSTPGNQNIHGVVAYELFADGFETGNTGRWSDVQP
jgi:hypothetical protein